MKKSRRKDKYSLKLIKCPYKESNTDGIKEYYERYMNDENRTFGKDGRTYYKIIECREWRINCAPILVMVDAKSYFNLVDKLIDENGVVYVNYGPEEAQLEGGIVIPAESARFVAGAQ